MKKAFILAALSIAPLAALQAAEPPTTPRPNILFAVADDQSFAHTSYAGYRAVSTPAFDRVAREGVQL